MRRGSIKRTVIRVERQQPVRAARPYPLPERRDVICPLFTLEGTHVGMILFANGSASATEGDCLIRAFPPTELPISQALFELQKLGEFHWQLDGDTVQNLHHDGSPAGQIRDGECSIDGHALRTELMDDA